MQGQISETWEQALLPRGPEKAIQIIQLNVEDEKILASNRTLCNNWVLTAKQHKTNLWKSYIHLGSQNLSVTYCGTCCPLIALILSLGPTSCMKIVDAFLLFKVIRDKYLYILYYIFIYLYLSSRSFKCYCISFNFHSPINFSTYLTI